MVDRDYYSKTELDQLIKQAKEEMITQIKEQIVLSTATANAPKVNTQTLSIKVLSTDQ